MTYQNKTIKEIIDDECYPYYDILAKVISRIDNKTSNIHKVIGSDAICYSIRNIEYARIIPLDDGVAIEVEVPYNRIIDLAGKCIVDAFAGHNEVDIVKFVIQNPMNIQYAISMYDQAYTYVKRLKLD